MKRKHTRYLLGTIIIGLCLGGCSKILQETPRSSYTPQFFQTKAGIIGGLTEMYANLRNIYGQPYYYGTNEVGTDESTYGQTLDGNFTVMDMTGQGLISSTTSRTDAIWGTSFTNINTASGVIQYGTTAGVDSSLLAEAHFFRAFDYFLLVQTFGGVPLDLGSGNLQFNITPSVSSVRNTVPEVYTKCIFPDLIKAVNNLPMAARLTGTVTKPVAQLYLAKAYLTYAWWLKNPNKIPTYPAVTDPRVDPDGHNSQWYYQQAYNIATNTIENPGSFGLQPTFYDVNNGANDRNNEIMLYADHTQTSAQYNGGSLTYSSNSTDNVSAWMQNWNYPAMTSSDSSTAWVPINSVQRASVQGYGRPWVRMAPTVGAIENTFADKSNDSRYDGTFMTVYRCNMNESGLSKKYSKLYNANLMPIGEGDAVVTFLDTEPSQTIDYSNSVYKSGMGLGVLPNRADFVVGPNGISRLVFPGLWKISNYRTDNAGTLGNPNAGSTRPWDIDKFSELFFVAAEAAVEGASTTSVTGTYSNDGTARGLINILRARAGMWNFSNAQNSAKVADNSAAMVAATPATITIDYILAERSREYYGEGYRWFDLVRTQEWANLASTYQICGSAPGDHTLKTSTRDIEPYLYLRPIPQGQLDAMQVSDDIKKAYQNPGYL
ncbi:RagB/SusD family nutrient uptake outer membrane protein [Arachidicoccus sp.]|uniref:RagB/SusD family nutrient uptake outer membrane protein n=1 Tax=Arachidicoccus sp. TaxID=1872624 RepID=UPI003D23BF7C